MKNYFEENSIIWKNKEYLNSIKKEIEINKNLFFNPEFKYKVTWIKKLGEGSYGIVHQFKIDIYFNSNKKTVFLAGKILKSNKNFINFKEYVLKLYYMKLLNINSVSTVKIFNPNFNNILNKDNLINIGGLFNKKKYSIYEIIFLSDLSKISNVKKIFPINSKKYLNNEILNLSFERRLKIYDNIIKDIFQLYQNGIEIKSIDLWIIIIYSNSNFETLLIDVDFITYRKNSVDLYLKNLDFGFKLLFDKDFEFLENEYKYIIKKLHEIFNKNQT
jgi:hypothetical protein